MPPYELAASPAELTARNIVVWPVRITESDSVAARFQRVLAANEVARADRFRYDNLRRSFVISRGALRVLLGRYLAKPPEDVHLRYGVKGKPSVDAGVPIQFNASHSSAVALFAFALGCEIGVDVERIRPLRYIREIASRFFCAEEAAELLSLPVCQRERGFFLCWTRKEAYVKAVGEGLSTPFDGFRVTLRPGETPRFVHLGQEEAPRAWALHDIEVESTSRYAAALAYRDVPRSVHVLPMIEPGELFDMP